VELNAFVFLRVYPTLLEKYGKKWLTLVVRLILFIAERKLLWMYFQVKLDFPIFISKVGI